MEEEMDQLNISVSSLSLPPFSNLEKPSYPIRAQSCTNLAKQKTGGSLTPSKMAKSRDNLINIHSVETTLFESAVDMTNNQNVHGKRERKASSQDIINPPGKPAKNLRFSTSNESTETNSCSALLQNNANESEGTETLDEDKEKYVVNRAAAPMWTSARRHRLAEAKANMRALHYETLLEHDTIPGPFLGVEKIPRYLLQEDGTLSEALTQLIREQSIARTKLVIEELRETEKNDRRRAQYYNGICEQLYQQEEDASYPRAASLQTSLVTHFKQIEAKRLQICSTKSWSANHWITKPSHNYFVDLRMRSRPRAPTRATSARVPRRPPRMTMQPTKLLNHQPNSQHSSQTRQLGQPTLNQPTTFMTTTTGAEGKTGAGADPPLGIDPAHVAKTTTEAMPGHGVAKVTPPQPSHPATQ